LELETKIAAVFNMIAPPSMPQKYQHYPESESYLETKGFWGKSWAELNFEDFENNMFCFTLFPDGSIPYFLGAFMFVACKKQVYVTDSFSNYFFSPSFSWRVFQQLTNEQIDVCKKFAEIAILHVDEDDADDYHFFVDNLNYVAKLREN